jgi:hypothetical protein
VAQLLNANIPAAMHLLNLFQKAEASLYQPGFSFPRTPRAEIEALSRQGRVPTGAVKVPAGFQKAPAKKLYAWAAELLNLSYRLAGCPKEPFSADALRKMHKERSPKKSVCDYLAQH